MRIFGRKIFENDYQRQLDNLAEYHKIRSREELSPLVNELAWAERRAFLISMAMWHHTMEEGFSIRDIIDTMEHARFSRPYQTHPSGVENIDDAVAGGEFVAYRLIQQANQLARGILPGATQELGGAFDDPQVSS